MTITRDDVGLRTRSFVAHGCVTTAHYHIARFYLEAERERSRPSWVQRIAAAPSIFGVEGLVADFVLFGSRHASEKTRAQVFETARVRTCELRGMLP